uniref:Uncharacterized protein n=1 Tax=Ditylenchus dipsaci TaxID=166011 RepID=A0A915CXC0_9BILA
MEAKSICEPYDSTSDGVTSFFLAYMNNIHTFQHDPDCEKWQRQGQRSLLHPTTQRHQQGNVPQRNLGDD